MSNHLHACCNTAIARYSWIKTIVVAKAKVFLYLEAWVRIGRGILHAKGLREFVIAQLFQRVPRMELKYNCVFAKNRFHTKCLQRETVKAVAVVVVACVMFTAFEKRSHNFPSRPPSSLECERGEREGERERERRDSQITIHCKASDIWKRFNYLLNYNSFTTDLERNFRENKLCN
jgi:hypothetical protein